MNNSNNNKRSQWKHCKVLIVTVTLSIICRITDSCIAHLMVGCTVHSLWLFGFIEWFVCTKSTSGNNKTISGISQMSATLPAASIKLISNWMPTKHIACMYCMTLFDKELPMSHYFLSFFPDGRSFWPIHFVENGWHFAQFVDYLSNSHWRNTFSMQMRTMCANVSYSVI